MAVKQLTVFMSGIEPARDLLVKSGNKTLFEFSELHIPAHLFPAFVVCIRLWAACCQHDLTYLEIASLCPFPEYLSDWLHRKIKKSVTPPHLFDTQRTIHCTVISRLQVIAAGGVPPTEVLTGNGFRPTDEKIEEYYQSVDRVRSAISSHVAALHA